MSNKLTFRCPKCNCDELEVILSSCTVTESVEHDPENNCLNFYNESIENGITERFQCSDCGFILPVDEMDEVIEWLRQQPHNAVAEDQKEVLTAPTAEIAGADTQSVESAKKTE